MRRETHVSRPESLPYPDLADPLDRRRFLSACARAAALAGTGLVLGGGSTSCEPDPGGFPLAGDPIPSTWPRPQVRLVSETPVGVTFRDGRAAVIAVAVVIGPGPEPIVDREALEATVQEACRAFDSDCLRSEDARLTLEAQLQGRLDELLKACGSSIEAVSVVPASFAEEGDSAAQAPASGADAAPPAPRDPGIPQRSALPPLRGRCPVHGDGPCPGA